MKKLMRNNSHLEGFVYEHKLEKKVSGPNSKNPGTEFINGTLSIATDDNLMNVVQVHFSYVTPVTKKGGSNATYNILAAIIDGRIPNVMEHGKENAGRVRVDSAIGLNEWYDAQNNGELISVKRNEGGFVHQLNANEILNEKVDARATFDVDMLIMRTIRVEADDERNTPEKMTLRGYIFDFRNSLLPIDLTVFNPRAMNYFESQDISEKNPFFTRLQGRQIAGTRVKEVTESSAFGDAIVKQTKTSYREFEVTWATDNPYTWDDESTILATELQELIAQRELYLASVKKRQDDYLASRGNAFTNTTTVEKGKYDF